MGIVLKQGCRVSGVGVCRGIVVALRVCVSLISANYTGTSCFTVRPTPCHFLVSALQHSRTHSHTHTPPQRLTWTAQRFLGGDAPVAGGAECGGGHGEGGEEVAVTVARLPLPRFLLSLLHPLLLFVLENNEQSVQRVRYLY